MVTSRVATRNYAVDLSRPGGAQKAIRPIGTFSSGRPGRCRPTVSSRPRPSRSPAAPRRTLKRHGPSMSGSSIIRSAIRRRAAAALAISALCWSRRIWAGNAPTSTRFLSVWPAPRAFQRATYMAFGSPSPTWVTRALALHRKTSRNPSTAAPRCTSTSHGWVPVDPADVRKVVLEEPPGNRPLDDPTVTKGASAIIRILGDDSMAYNFAHYVGLPGSAGAPVGFLMYPQAETQQRQAGQPGSKRLPVRDYVQGNPVGDEIEGIAPAAILRPCSKFQEGRSRCRQLRLRVLLFSV